jgi:hypothetical protein
MDAVSFGKKKVSGGQVLQAYEITYQQLSM